MSSDEVLVETDGPFAVITMNRPDLRNALSVSHMRALTAAFRQVGETDAAGTVLAGNGPVFSAGHDFADLAGADLATAREMLLTCRELMETIQSVLLVVFVCVHELVFFVCCLFVVFCVF